MFTVVITEKGGSQRKLEFDKPEVTIGRVQGNDIILPKGNVSKRHSRIVLKDSRFIVVDLKSTNGTYVNGRKITSPLVVKSGDKIYIGDFILTVEDPSGVAYADEGDAAPAPASQPPPPASERRPPPLRSQPPPAMSAPQMAAPQMAPPPMAAPQMSHAPVARPTVRGFEGPPSAPPPLPSRGESQQAQPPRPMPASQPPAERFALDEDPSDESVPPQPRVSDRGVPAMLRSPEPTSSDTPTPAPPAPRERPSSQQYAAPAPYTAPVQAPAPYTAPVQAPAPYAAPSAQTAPAPYTPPAAVPAYVAQQQPYAAPPVAAAYVPPPQFGGRPIAARSVPQVALRTLIARVAQSFDVRVVDPRALADEQRWRDAQRAIDAGIAALATEGALDGADRESLGSAALREAVGLGVLDALLGDASVREVLVEGPSRVLVDSGEGLVATPLVFSSHEALRTTARRILGQTGADLDPSRPVSEARIGDQWSAHLVGAPVITAGAVLILTRIDRRASPASALVERGMLSGADLERLRAAVAGRRNVLVSGSGGVTELLGALAGLIDARERIAIIEDVAGLAVDHANSVSFSAGGVGSKLGLRDVLREAERLRTERLVIDDIRGAEAYDVLVAMAGRRGGVLAGVHASSPDDALRHLEMLAALDGRVSAPGAHALVRSAVHVVVQMAIGPDGVRRVVAIEDVR